MTETIVIVGAGVACLCVAAVMWLRQRRKPATWQPAHRVTGLDTADLDGQ